MTTHALMDFLQLAVPLRILEINRMLDADETTIPEIVEQARPYVDDLTARGDTIFFAAPETGESVKPLITALAVLAIAAPGGVTFAGIHFCASPPCPLCPTEDYRPDVSALRGVLS